MQLQPAADVAPSPAEPAELQESELGLSFLHKKKFLLKVQLQNLDSWCGWKMQRKRDHLHSYSRSWPGLPKFTALIFKQAFPAIEDAPCMAKHSWSCAIARTRQWGTGRGHVPPLFRELQLTHCQWLFWKLPIGWQCQLKSVRALQDGAPFPKLLWE